jgi:hypothetical protein
MSTPLTAHQPPAHEDRDESRAPVSTTVWGGLQVRRALRGALSVRFDSLYSRIACVFALVLIVFGAALGWLAYAAAKYHQHDVMQQLSRDLAQRIVSQESLMAAEGVDRESVETLFRMTVAVNPSIEVYLPMAKAGLCALASGAHLFAARSPAPIHDFLACAASDRRDSPRTPPGRKCSASRRSCRVDAPPGICMFCW